MGALSGPGAAPAAGERRRDYLANVVAQALGRVLTAGASLVASVMVARGLGVDAYGRFAYVLVFLAVAVNLAELGTNSVLGRELARGGDAATLWGTFLTLRLILSVGVAVVLAPAAWLLNPPLAPYVAAGLLGLPFLSSRFFEPVFQATGRPWRSTTASAVYALALASATSAAIAAGGGVAAMMAVYVSANALYVAVAFALSWPLLRPRFVADGKALLGLARLATPLALGSLIAAVNARGDVFVLGRLASAHELGIYSAAYRILEVAGLAAIVLVTPSIQVFTAEAHLGTEALRAGFARVIVALGLLTIPVALAAPRLSPLVVGTIFGRDFAGSAPVLEVLAWVGVLVFFYLFGYALCVAIDAVWMGTALVTGAGALNLVLNWLWVPRHGAMGTAWARLVSDLLLTASTLAYVAFRVGNVFDGAAWARLALLAFAFWLIIRTLYPVLGPAAVVLAAVTYALCAFLLRVVPRAEAGVRLRG